MDDDSTEHNISAFKIKKTSYGKRMFSDATDPCLISTLCVWRFWSIWRLLGVWIRLIWRVRRTFYVTAATLFVLTRRTERRWSKLVLNLYGTSSNSVRKEKSYRATQSLTLMWWTLAILLMAEGTMWDFPLFSPWLRSKSKKVARLALQIPLTVAVWGGSPMVPRSKS